MFWIKLTVLLGYPSVKKLQEEIDKELVEWIAYDQATGGVDFL